MRVLTAALGEGKRQFRLEPKARGPLALCTPRRPPSSLAKVPLCLTTMQECGEETRSGSVDMLDLQLHILPPAVTDFLETVLETGFRDGASLDRRK